MTKHELITNVLERTMYNRMVWGLITKAFKSVLYSASWSSCAQPHMAGNIHDLNALGIKPNTMR